MLCLIGLPRGRLNPAGPEAFLLLGYMILLSAVAFVIWTALLYYNPVGKITVYNFMTPVFGVILSAACLGENLWDWRYLVALALVCFGIFAVNRVAGTGGAKDKRKIACGKQPRPACAAACRKSFLKRLGFRFQKSAGRCCKKSERGIIDKRKGVSESFGDAFSDVKSEKEV